MALVASITALALLGRTVQAGFVPPAEWCLPDSGLKELSGCVAMVNTEERCAGLVKADREAGLDCFCTQEMFLAYQDCQANVQLCLASHMFDHQFGEKLKAWHKLCDPRSTVTSRTEMPTITSTYDFGACDRLYGSCISADYETNKCRETYLSKSSSVDFVSCVCQTPVWNLISACQYDGNVSCLRRAGDEDMIIGAGVCPYFWSGSETLPPTDISSWISASGDPNKMRPTDAHAGLGTPGAMLGSMPPMQTAKKTAPPNEDL